MGGTEGAEDRGVAGETDGLSAKSGRDSPETAPPSISADVSSALLPELLNEGGATSGADDDVVDGVEGPEGADEPASSRARR